MDTPLDEQYLTWLYARIGSITERNRTRTYWTLFKQLYTQEFVWIIPNDDNRVEDGRDLRMEFIEEMDLSGRVDPDWLGLGCSVLELLMGLAKRLAFEADRTPRFWFFDMLRNLNLYHCTDSWYVTHNAEEVEDILGRFIWRVYEPNGQGGLFPLKNPSEDQREIELWYQLCSYVLERI
jgi:hypothetical protein